MQLSCCRDSRDSSHMTWTGLVSPMTLYLNNDSPLTQEITSSFSWWQPIMWCYVGFRVKTVKTWNDFIWIIGTNTEIEPVALSEQNHATHKLLHRKSEIKQSDHSEPHDWSLTLFQDPSLTKCGFTKGPLTVPRGRASCYWARNPESNQQLRTWRAFIYELNTHI